MSGTQLTNESEEDHNEGSMSARNESIDNVIGRSRKVQTEFKESILDWVENTRVSASKKSDLADIVDQHTSAMKGEMKRMRRLNRELECKLKRSEENRSSQRCKWEEILADMGLRSEDDIVVMFRKLRSNIRQKNELISDLMKHWKADIVEDLFLLPKQSDRDSIIRTSEVFERKSYVTDTIGSAEKGTEKGKEKKKSSVRESSSESDPSSNSDKKKRRRREEKKSKKKRSHSSFDSEQSEKRQRNKEKDRRRLIRSLPRMELYDGDKEGWKIFSDGFKMRYEDIDDKDGVVILREYLTGEAKRTFKGLPKEIEKKGWRKSLKWLKERIIGGSMYKMIDYERQLRLQQVDGRRVAEVCEEFTRWIHKLYDKEKIREEMKKRQLLLLYEASDEYARLLEMLDSKESFEEMKTHLERKEYAKRLEMERRESPKYDQSPLRSQQVTEKNNDVKCYRCNEWGHRARECMHRASPNANGRLEENPRMTGGSSDQYRSFQNGCNDVRSQQLLNEKPWEIKDRPYPKKDPEKGQVLSVRVHPSMYDS